MVRVWVCWFVYVFMNVHRVHVRVWWCGVVCPASSCRICLHHVHTGTALLFLWFFSFPWFSFDLDFYRFESLKFLSSFFRPVLLHWWTGCSDGLFSFSYISLESPFQCLASQTYPSSVPPTHPRLFYLIAFLFVSHANIAHLSVEEAQPIVFPRFSGTLEYSVTLRLNSCSLFYCSLLLSLPFFAFTILSASASSFHNFYLFLSQFTLLIVPQFLYVRLQSQ